MIAFTLKQRPIVMSRKPPMDDVSKLQADVSALATPQGRRVGTRGHDAAKDYLLARMGDLDLRPYHAESSELRYESGGQTFSNLVAVVPGEDRSLAPILVGAHYDSVISSYCADDNAAAVAIALLAAEKLKDLGLQRDTVIALFDAEEPPYFHSDDMGSTRFYREQGRPEGFHAAVIMDLVGHDVELPIRGLSALGGALANLLFMTGAESHAAFPQLVRSCLPGPQLPLIASLNRNVGDMSDHHVFRLNAVPYLFLSCGRWQHYHQATDTPDRLNYEKMERTCSFLVGLCQTLAATDLPRDERSTVPDCIANGVVDTTALEIELLERALGPALHPFLAAVGMESLASRQDLDQLALRLQSFFEI
jgi:hypothetical protein